MATKSTPVQPVRVTYVCDACKKGQLTYTGNYTSTTFASTYDHRCSDCGQQESLDTVYPYIKYQDIPKEPKVVSLTK